MAPGLQLKGWSACCMPEVWTRTKQVLLACSEQPGVARVAVQCVTKHCTTVVLGIHVALHVAAARPLGLFRRCGLCNGVLWDKHESIISRCSMRPRRV